MTPFFSNASSLFVVEKNDSRCCLWKKYKLVGLACLSYCLQACLGCVTALYSVTCVTNICDRSNVTFSVTASYLSLVLAMGYIKIALNMF